MVDNVKEKVALTERDNTLFVDYVNKTNFNYYQSGIVVVCPEVNTVITTPLAPHQVMFWERAVTKVSGFTQDVMNIVVGKDTQFELDENAIGKLNAAATASDATITVNTHNQIQAADFKIAGKSELKLLSQIAKSNYSYTDSATITLNGKSFAKVNQNWPITFAINIGFHTLSLLLSYHHNMPPYLGGIFIINLNYLSHYQ